MSKDSFAFALLLAFTLTLFGVGSCSYEPKKPVMADETYVTTDTGHAIIDSMNESHLILQQINEDLKIMVKDVEELRRKVEERQAKKEKADVQ